MWRGRCWEIVHDHEPRYFSNVSLNNNTLFLSVDYNLLFTGYAFWSMIRRFLRNMEIRASHTVVLSAMTWNSQGPTSGFYRHWDTSASKSVIVSPGCRVRTSWGAFKKSSAQVAPRSIEIRSKEGGIQSLAFVRSFLDYFNM